MESYEKLKKRTFKLTYISEAEDKKKGEENQEVKAEPGGAAESALQQILSKAAEGESQDIIDPTYPGLAAFKMWIGKSGAFPGGVVSSGSNLGQTYILDKNKAWVTTPKAVKMKEALLNAMGGGEEAKLSPGQQADKTAAEEARLEAEAKELRLTTLGSLIEEANAENPEEPRFLNPKAIKGLETKNATQLDELCAKGLLSDTVCKSDRVRSQYIGGSRGIKKFRKKHASTAKVQYFAIAFHIALPK